MRRDRPVSSQALFSWEEKDYRSHHLGNEAQEPGDREDD